MLIIIRSGRLAKIRWSVLYLKIPVEFLLVILQDRFLIVHIPFDRMQNSQWITLPTYSCLVLHTFSANLLHSLIMRLIVSSLSPQNLHLLFCCILSVLAFIGLVFMVLFCTVIRRYSVFLVRFPFSWPYPRFLVAS